MLPNQSGSRDADSTPEESPVPGVSTEQLNMFKQLYHKLVRHPEGLSKEELCHDTFGLEQGYFADRIFALFASNLSGRVGESGFICGLSRLVSQDENEFVDFLFDLIDADGSGQIDRDEVYHGMLASLRANKLTLAYRVTDFLDAKSGLPADMASDEARAQALADEVFKGSAAGATDATGAKTISRDDFKRVYQAYMSQWGKTAPQLTKTRITTRNFQNYLKRSQCQSFDKWSLKRRPFHKRVILWVEQNPTRVLWFSVWVLINVGLFTWKFTTYTFGRPEAFELFGYCLSFARGSAEVSRVNIAYMFSSCGLIEGFNLKREIELEVQRCHRFVECLPRLLDLFEKYSERGSIAYCQHGRRDCNSQALWRGHFVLRHHAHCCSRV